LHVVIAVDGGQKGFDFFQIGGAQAGRVNGVFRLVAQFGLGRVIN
jgi:hypothetical protein